MLALRSYDGVRVLLSVFVLVAALPLLGISSPTVVLYTDSSDYHEGDEIEVSISAQNFGPEMSVDVYFGLLGPGASVYTYSGGAWGESFDPWISNLFVPSPFLMRPEPFLWLSTPSERPPIERSGHYSFGIGMTDVGQPDFISDVYFAPFEYTESPGPDYYVDGSLGNDANDGSAESPFKTIGHAIVAAVPPATIHVASGVYSSATNGEMFPLQMRTMVNLKGEDRETTFLDAGGCNCDVIRAAIMTIEGFTITGGSRGIHCENASPTIRDNIVTGNVGDEPGAGICCFSCSPEIVSNIITDNWSDTYGGAIYCNFSFPRIESNVITFNTAHSGAGIRCAWGSEPEITGNFISGNVADYGAGINVMNNDGSLASTGPAIRNNIIVGNYANAYSGGIYSIDASPLIDNNTVANNDACWPEGGGILHLEGGAPQIENCIIWGNGDDLYQCVARYCCIEDGDPGMGNIHDDPMFVSGLFGDYYLDPQSPCIDAGSRSAAAARLDGRTTQPDGSPDSGQVDMGYHYPIP